MRDKGIIWGVLLYLLTLVCEIPAIVVRALVAGFIFTRVLSWVTGTGQYFDIGANLAGLWAVLPVLVSLVTLLFLPSGGGWLMRREMQARKPSEREGKAIGDALDLVIPAGSKVPRPSKIFVVNSPELNAAIVGTSLYVWQGVIWTAHLPPIVAHELGHLASFDGRLTVGTRRLVYPFFGPLGRVLVRSWDKLGCYGLFFGALFVVLAGGFGLFLLQVVWRAYWRNREFAADAYAAELGQARPLAELLEQFLYLDPLIPWIGSYYPPTEYRIDRLLAYEQA
jgi:Zn-dependent protease with chaperone function